MSHQLPKSGLTDLNVQPKTINLVGEKKNRKHLTIMIRKRLLGKDLKSTCNKTTRDKWDHVKLKCFYTAKRNMLMHTSLAKIPHLI